MKCKFPTFADLLVLTLVLTVSCSRADNSLMAGTSSRDITPQERMPMWGYAFRHDALSEGILDPLQAHALVIQVGREKLAMVSLDLGRTPGKKTLDSIQRRIRTEAGIEHSFVAASHTHHGPVVELSDEPGLGHGRFDAALRYYTYLEDQTVAAILEADRNLQPATVVSGKTHLQNFNMNRQSNDDPAPNDSELSLIRFDDRNHKPIALLVNFAAHPTMVSESLMKFSADYVGVMNQSLREQLGANVLFIQGAAGDEAPLGHVDYLGYGKALAHEVIRLSSTLQSGDTNPPTLTVREKDFQFPSRLNLNNPTIRAKCDTAFFPELIANYADEFSRGIKPHLIVAMLNRETAFVGVSGEFFCNHSIRLKERARIKNLFFVGYCDGYQEYFPTIEAVAEGGYGTDTASAPAAVGAGEQIMDTALILLYEMQGQIRQPGLP